MTYPEAIEYLYARLPVFHRIGARAIKPGLNNIIRLCEALGNPQRHLRCIHVGGTNGKGSSSHMLAAIYQSAGYRTGLYTSPHLKSFTERIRVDGVPIAEEFVADFVTNYQTLIEEIEPSFFEVTVAMAFLYFHRQQIDVAIIEVGLGGRLDSTNIITPLVSLITNIGWDHSDVLGDSLEAIALEKAGIIKSGVPVIISEHSLETDSVFYQTAQAKGSSIFFAADQYQVSTGESTAYSRAFTVTDAGGKTTFYNVGLTGDYQTKNVAGVLAVISLLQSTFPVSESAIVQGLRDVVSLTGLKGRWQVLRRDPLVICDTAHNEPGMQAVVEQLRDMPYGRLHLIIGFVRDKDVRKVLTLLPEEAVYYFCEPEGNRSLPAEELQTLSIEQNRRGLLIKDVNAAIKLAVSEASSDDLILVTGSNYLIAGINDL